MLKILRTEGVEFDVIDYVQNPLERHEIERIIELVPDAPIALVRAGKEFEQLGLSAADLTTKSSVVELLLEYPRLMQRPIVRSESSAVIARPSTLVSRVT